MRESHTAAKFSTFFIETVEKDLRNGQGFVSCLSRKSNIKVFLRTKTFLKRTLERIPKLTNLDKSSSSSYSDEQIRKFTFCKVATVANLYSGAICDCVNFKREIDCTRLMLIWSYISCE